MSVIRLLVILAVVAFLVLAILIAVVVGMSWLGGESVPRSTLLEVNLEQFLPEHVQPDPISQALFPHTPDLRDFVDALEVAKNDDKVVGLVARIGSSGMGMAKIQEIRDAVLAFRESGKKAIAYAETFGELSSGNGAYYLATAFDEIYLQPSGDVGLTGLIAESPFLAGTFEKLGMSPRMDHRYEYKNALNQYTEKKFTAAHEEASRDLMEAQFGQIVHGICKARGLDEAALRALVDDGPFFGEEALEAGLVDALAYRDEVYAKAREEAGGNPSLLYLFRYLERAGRPHERGARIALVYGTGAVVRGSGGFDPISGSSAMGADTVAAALRSAVADPAVKAIVFRVDSPGGSYVASDTIWRETVRAQEAGKPVIVSMGDVAASGGYFVAAAADKIVAQPGTITGSIGVLGGKFVTTELWDKLGISWDEVHTSENSTMWTGTEDYTEKGWQRLEAWLDRVYVDFTGKVAEGRGMEREEVHEIAKGRVWSGEEAKELGLVDELGGFPVAYRLAREAAGLDPDAKIQVELFPRPRSAFEQLFGEQPESSESAALGLALHALETARPLLQLGQRLGLLEHAVQPLLMPELEAIP